MFATGLARIGNDPVIRFLNDGKPVLDLSLAFRYGKKDQNGKYPTQWVEATMYGDRCEKLVDYLRKGNQIVVYLEDVHVQTYTKKDGSMGSSLKARLNNLEFVNDRQDKPKEEVKEEPKQAVTFDDINDDVPF